MYNSGLSSVGSVPTSPHGQDHLENAQLHNAVGFRWVVVLGDDPNQSHFQNNMIMVLANTV